MSKASYNKKQGSRRKKTGVWGKEREKSGISR